VANHLQISHGSAYDIIHNFYWTKVCISIADNYWLTYLATRWKTTINTEHPLKMASC
jgi:hypothetical protein